LATHCHVPRHEYYTLFETDQRDTSTSVVLLYSLSQKGHLRLILSHRSNQRGRAFKGAIAREQSTILFRYDTTHPQANSTCADHVTRNRQHNHTHHKEPHQKYLEQTPHSTIYQETKYMPEQILYCSFVRSKQVQKTQLMISSRAPSTQRKHNAREIVYDMHITDHISDPPKNIEQNKTFLMRGKERRKRAC
jgi:hypothetical protein